MAHLYRATEWEVCGRWYCNDVEELSCKNSVASKWYVPARILKISPVDYVQLLVEKFKVDYISFKNDTLVFSWNKQSDMRIYKNWINRKAREANFVC